MSRFFIDLHDGANFVKDTEGFELTDEDAVREKLVRIMSKIAQGFEPVPERQDYLAVVRDETRRVVFRAHLTLDIERVEGA
ncbi:hypothetical protein G3T14_12270 [Methylobacterium sp. BTF04]|uniref:DUF6894 family protein n=1 Tax=Methylobacterium sp. BTF04 TaxID=2708300 RepID=UPI0013D4E984|nr:hypothetical protein [Methylobacterium sp. BTF04]NEU12908.1 hypothetical protein [Methylobacterium sp. BTF04]